MEDGGWRVADGGWRVEGGRLEYCQKSQYLSGSWLKQYHPAYNVSAVPDKTPIAMLIMPIANPNATPQNKKHQNSKPLCKIEMQRARLLQRPRRHEFLHVSNMCSIRQTPQPKHPAAVT